MAFKLGVLALLFADAILIKGSRQQATKTAAKARAHLPWPNLDADGGEEYEVGNQVDSASDSKTFSLSQYEHTDARDDADVAENEEYQDDSLNHGEEDPDDDSDASAPDFLQMRAKKTASKTRARLPWPNLDADGGEENEVGNQVDSASDSKTFSLSQYEHTDARDDADVAENEEYQDDSLNHGEEDPDDDSDASAPDFLQMRA